MMPPRESQHPGVEVKDDKIRIWFMYLDYRIREPLKLDPTPPNLKYAARLRAKIVREISLGTFDWHRYFPESRNQNRYLGSPEAPKLIDEQLDDWFDLNEPTWKASTKRDYRKSIKILKRDFGSIPVVEFKRRMATDWAREQTCTQKRLGNLISPMRQSLDLAVEDDLIPANPLSGWRYRIKSGPKVSDVDPFTPDEQSAIITALESQGANMVQFWLWTGLRPSELVALDWTDIDWMNGWVSITKGLTQAADDFEEPKTQAGERFVKLLEPARIALENQKQHTALKGQEIFQNPRTGDRWTGADPIRKTLWTPALRRAKVRYRRPYQCRHTYASMMLQSGDNVMWVARQLGHASWIQTAKCYARYIETADAAEGSKAVEKFGSYVPSLPRRSAK